MRILIGTICGIMGMYIAAIITAIGMALSAGTTIWEMNNVNFWSSFPQRLIDGQYNLPLFLLIVTGAGITIGVITYFCTTSLKSKAYGNAHWQTKRELKKNKMVNPPGYAFVFGKTGKSTSKGGFITSEEFPHAMMVAPTGSGKGVGFVIPNLLSFGGSTIVLDVKGENFNITSRRRVQIGDKVYRFAPFDEEGRTHRYNPLDAISEISNDRNRFSELNRLTDLFLQTKSPSSEAFMGSAKRLFIACALYVIEKSEKQNNGKSTASIGDIITFLQSNSNKKKLLGSCAEDTENEQAKGIFTEFSGLDSEIFDSYMSVLNDAGLSLWNDPAVVDATSATDFDFTSFRSKGQSLYICISPEDLKTLAPLIRMLFGQAIASLQRKEPDPEREQLPVMFMIDEFDQLGKLDIIIQSVKTLRSYGGRVMIITQSIPGIDAIYGMDNRLSLQAAAGVKIYLTPSEKKTAQEISHTLGVRTRKKVSKSIQHAKPSELWRGGSKSISDEKVPLLSEGDVMMFDRNKVIIMPNGQYPIKANRIKYYEDPFFIQAINSAKDIDLPMPDRVFEEAVPVQDNRPDS